MSVLRLALPVTAPMPVFAFLPTENLSEKEGIKPVTADKDQTFDFKQKRQTSHLGLY